MQKISIFIGGMLIALNVIALFCFPAYPLFNCVATSIIIVIEMIIQCAISKVCLKDGFKYSLATLMPIGAIVCIVLGVTANDRFENNINLSSKFRSSVRSCSLWMIPSGVPSLQYSSRTLQQPFCCPFSSDAMALTAFILAALVWV